MKNVSELISARVRFRAYTPEFTGEKKSEKVVKKKFPEAKKVPRGTFQNSYETYSADYFQNYYRFYSEPQDFPFLRKKCYDDYLLSLIHI